MRRGIHITVAVAILLLTPPGALAQREPPVQKELIERFGEWADNYTGSLPSYAAQETVRQTHFGRRGRPGEVRTATYSYTFTRSLEGPREFDEARTRTTSSENGDNSSAARLHNESSVSQFSKAALLVTRFGTRYHSRMNYFFVPEHPDSISNFVVVGYRQTSGEGLMEVDGKLVFPVGRAWIDANDGKIIRLEEEFGSVGKTRYSISVDFTVASELAGHSDAATQVWLPERVIVRIFDKDRLELQNEYTYSAFRPL